LKFTSVQSEAILLCQVGGKNSTISKPILNKPKFQRKPEFAWVWETPPELPAAMVASAS
jgi:hypothetical protein